MATLCMAALPKRVPSLKRHETCWLQRGEGSSRIAGLVHAVADPAHVEDVGGAIRFNAELAAEILHEGAHQPGVGMFPPGPTPAVTGNRTS